MNLHVASVHEEKKTFKRNLCGNSFSLKSNMNQHIATVPEGQKAFNCKLYEYSSGVAEA